MIKAVAFDGNGVLYYRDADFVDELCAFTVARIVPGLDRHRMATEFRKWMHEAFDGSIGKAEAVDRFLDALGITDLSARTRIKEKELELSRRIELFPSERETLLALDARGVRMGMITNSFQSAEEKIRWFKELGLDCAVRDVVSSIDFGASKPDPAIYLEFARRVGLPPEEIAFVGHEDFELRGAERAGLRTVSFNCPDSIPAEFHLNVFDELLDLVGR